MMSNLLIVDRISETVALCEDETRRIISLPLSLLPPELKEGDCIWEVSGAYVINREETQRRRAANAAFYRKLLNHPPDEEE